jgi:hypothetical protein
MPPAMTKAELAAHLEAARAQHVDDVTALS